MFNFFKKKPKTETKLNQALRLGLITEEEFFILDLKRAEKRLKAFQKKNEKKKK